MLKSLILLASMMIGFPSFAQIGVNTKKDIQKIGSKNIKNQNIITNAQSTEGCFLLFNNEFIYFKRSWSDHPGLYVSAFIPGDYSDAALTKKAVIAFSKLVLSKLDARALENYLDGQSFASRDTNFDIKHDTYSEFNVKIVYSEFGLHVILFYVYPA